LLKLLLLLAKAIITLVFEKNAIFSPKIGKKSQKIVIITSTPGHTAKLQIGNKFSDEKSRPPFFFASAILVSDVPKSGKPQTGNFNVSKNIFDEELSENIGVFTSYTADYA
jgi:hypothetical protein